MSLDTFVVSTADLLATEPGETKPPPMVFIVASNSHQVRRWAEVYGLARGQYAFLNRPEQILGVADPLVLLDATCMNLHGWWRLQEAIYSRRGATVAHLDSGLPGDVSYPGGVLRPRKNSC